MLGVRRNRKAHSSPNFLGGFRKKKPRLYIFLFFFSCFEIIKPHKRPFSEIGLSQSHKARLSEEWWGLTSEEGRRGPQSRNICCSQYLVPVLPYIKTKVVQLSIFQRIVTKKESSKLKAVQAKLEAEYQKGHMKRAFAEEEISEVTSVLEISNECFERCPRTLQFGALTFLWRVGENSRNKHYYQGKTSAIFWVPVNLIDSWLFWPWKKTWISKTDPVLCTTWGSSVNTMKRMGFENFHFSPYPFSLPHSIVFHAQLIL